GSGKTHGRLLEEVAARSPAAPEFQAHERDEFNSLPRSENTTCRDFIPQLKKEVSRCTYSDRLDEQLCDRLEADINNLTPQRRLLEKKDLAFAKAQKICEQHDDIIQATSSGSDTLLQRH
ncbi:unnamed protein product, partial [Echinostoma caproni]|uniref:Tektin n=1 Tax=Echinostoma caproni TaxID=27848 RepID=A0A183BAI3_9TREM